MSPPISEMDCTVTRYQTILIITYSLVLIISGGKRGVSVYPHSSIAWCLQSDRCREGDGVSILGVGSRGQWGGNNVARSVANQDEKVVTGSTFR